MENETSAVTKLVQRSERNKNGEGVRPFDLQTEVHERIRTFIPCIGHFFPTTIPTTQIERPGTITNLGGD